MEQQFIKPSLSMINYFQVFLEVERMEISLHPELCNKIPGFKAGIIQYSGIEIGPSPQMVKGRLQLFQESLYFDLQDQELTDFSGLKEWRQIFKAAGTDPSRYRPSVEALYRRIKKQNYLVPVHSAIDLNNFFSLQYEVPIGIYDLAELKTGITIRIGYPNEEYTGLNGCNNSIHNMITSADDIGPFGSPYVDSSRTKVTEETTEALQIIYLKSSISIEEGDQLTKSLMNMFLQVHGGEGSYEILSC